MSGTLAILGAGGHGRVVADVALSAGWVDVVFFDDAWPRLTSNRAFPVLGDTAALLAAADQFRELAVAIGDNQTRLFHCEKFMTAGFTLPVIVHARGYVASDAELGPGTVVCAGAVVQPGCSVGVAGIVNTSATLDHDCVLADAVHICPGAHLAGAATVGTRTWIGLGACVNQGLTIGQNVIVGAGAAVISDVADGLTVVGNPARVQLKD